MQWARGVGTAASTVWCFFAKRAITCKKKPRTPRSSSADEEGAFARPGERCRAGVRQIIEEQGARLLYLPPCSPDFNPIELAFAKLKALIRTAAPRTIADLWQTLANALDAFQPTECLNYFNAAGYDLDQVETALASARTKTTWDRQA